MRLDKSISLRIQTCRAASTVARRASGTWGAARSLGGSGLRAGVLNQLLAQSGILGQYARMWPRDVFYRRLDLARRSNVRTEKAHPGRPAPLLFRTIELLAKPGVYILYRGDVPYYVGQAKKLRSRLWRHACVPDGRYFNHWNFFSAFVTEDRDHRNQVESILIAAMPTANSMKPLKKTALPREVIKMVRQIQHAQANPFLESRGD